MLRPKPTFMNYFYDQWGRRYRWSDAEAVNTLVNLKQTNGSNPWPVIEKCIDIWEKTQVQEYRSFLIDLGKIRSTRKDAKFASTKDRVTGGHLRYTLDIPEKVMYMIRCLYTPQELPMKRAFFLEWARRFPKMKVAEKV